MSSGDDVSDLPQHETGQRIVVVTYMSQNDQTWTHTIALQLEILPGNKVLVPGFEPASASSSRTLLAHLAKQGARAALVDVKEVIRAIPGSKIRYGINYNTNNRRQAWLVLPPLEPRCPCKGYPDYYKVLKDLANIELPAQESYDVCDIIGMGYCPHPDFKLDSHPPADPYVSEGHLVAAGGVLPPLPHWQGGGRPGAVM